MDERNSGRCAVVRPCDRIVPQLITVAPSRELPFVTVQNAAMYVFDLKNDAPVVREKTGGPLKDYTCVPWRCRNGS